MEQYPKVVAQATDVLRQAGIGGPYGLAIGPEIYTGIVETTEHGGHLLLDHLRQILGGPLVWAPGVQGGVVLSLRGGDFVLDSGQDLSIGYLDHDARRRASLRRGELQLPGARARRRGDLAARRADRPDAPGRATSGARRPGTTVRTSTVRRARRAAAAAVRSRARLGRAVRGAPADVREPGRPGRRPGAMRPLVGAYYYLWNPENFAGGTLRAHLVPPQQPAASQVDSSSPRTAARDITNARRAGIDFFAVDWWPYDPGYSGRDYRQADAAMKDFLAAPDLGQMQVRHVLRDLEPRLRSRCASPRRSPSRWSCTSTRTWSPSPSTTSRTASYLRIDGRPGRLLVPDPDADRQRRRHDPGRPHRARRPTAIDPFFIGDEVYWRVTPENLNPERPGPHHHPQVSRIEQFDAVTSYILYFGDPDPALGPIDDFTGYPGTTDIVADEKRPLEEYRAATDDRVPVIPDVGPASTTAASASPRTIRPSRVSGCRARVPSSTLDHLFRGWPSRSWTPRSPW